jgi:hypothetical protein
MPTAVGVTSAGRAGGCSWTARAADGSPLLGLMADAFEDSVRHRAGRGGPIGLAKSAKPLDRPQERLVDGLAQLAAGEVRACAPASDAASLALGDLRETFARLFTAADE